MTITEVRDAAAESVSAEQREVVVSRVLDAPIALVWKAWTDPNMLARWWGPRTFTNPFCEVDVRPGGALKIVMRGPDGTDHPMTGTFLEVIEPELIVLIARVFEDESGNAPLQTLSTVTFEDLGVKTKLTVRSGVVHAAPEMAGAVDGMNEGWTQSIDKLAEEVASAIA